jgi:ribose transport system substrate-binding protein
MTKHLYHILIIILSAVWLTACSPAQQTAPSGDEEAVNHFVPLTDIAEGRKNIYLILKLIDSSYWKVIIDGAKRAGEDTGCNIYYGSTLNETNWQGQHVLIEEALSRNPDAIILSPDDSARLAPDIDRIHDLGIPVILIDTAANTESYDLCLMTDNLLAGQHAAQEMLTKFYEASYKEEEELTVGILVGLDSSQTINERLAGFLQYWSTHAPEKWQIMPDILNCKGDVETGKQLIQDLISQQPGIDGLYATNNTPTRAISTVIKESKRTDITVVGFDYSDEIRELLESPDYRASTMLQRQYDMGYDSVCTVMDIFKGLKPRIKFQDTGVVTVNRESLDDPEIHKILELY